MPFKAPKVKGRDMAKLAKSLLLLGGPAGAFLRGAKQVVPGSSVLVKQGKATLSPELLQLGTQTGSGKLAKKLPGGVFSSTRSTKDKMGELLGELLNRPRIGNPRPGRN